MLKDLLPEGVRVYLRWLKTRLKYPQARIAQTAAVDGGCQLGEHVVVHPGARICGSSIGRFTYIGNHASIIQGAVGSFCSIAACAAIGGGIHPINHWVSTSPVFFSPKRQCGISFTSQQEFEEDISVEIGHDVWVGYGAIVLPGVKVADGAVIGAGAVVTRDVEPYAIVAGVPARTLRKRFTDAQIQWLRQFRWWERSEAWLRAHRDLFADIQKLQNHGETR